MAATLQDTTLLRGQPLFISYDDEDGDTFGDEEEEDLDEFGLGEEDDDLDGDEGGDLEDEESE